MPLPPLLLLIVVLLAVASMAPARTPAFDQNYVPAWGADDFHLVNQGTKIRLAMDKNSGAGFASKLSYGSGFFRMRIKVPGGYTAGVVTAFYLTSEPDSGNHDEVDFEFLGNVDGKPITLQTNVFVNGHGRREQSLHLWFNPAANFHDYKILWNPYQLVIFVDERPIRVLRNLTGSVPGYEFPAKPMRVRASLWDGSAWATDGGKTKIDWNRAPFTAGFQGFSIHACGSNSSTPCNSPDRRWNRNKYRSLTAEQRAAYQNVQKMYMIYDYCADKKERFKNGTVPAECSYN
ncbi:xyloglucan endotransglucosylase/hydrolase protein 2-like [Lolium perenne]|uniref:xyloglucan endotransglucosylase/hydrolase protein 2-like n=1 Tax=Lolium perenne TaxID=4522 RepID=UPI0021F52C59|nr:xyloglucan endotransglucosylase/hydrolase protein 2-like [Lolium perenne]